MDVMLNVTREMEWVEEGTIDKVQGQLQQENKVMNNTKY
mgnify:CR=1 FL=1